MPKINVLDKKVYNRIAAGEVIERPFSVVKELVENALDAGASSITITIKDGGKSLIRVSDDGCGIEKSELNKAFLPHATSKIETADDLNSIMTLGFRGEALPSIASVSKVTITSRTSNEEVGYTIVSDDCVLSDIEPYPSNVGTTVSVENLFSNIPARYKFLRPAKNEETDITNILIRLILAHPNVAFKYVSDERVVYNFSGAGLDDAIIEIYGYETISNCINIHSERNGIKISGYIGKLNFYKANKTYQTIILNGRYIVNPTIQTAIQCAYANYLMKRQYPFYVLNVTVPTEIVDVNVHPSKIDVRFVDNQVIFGTFKHVISSVIDGDNEALEIIVPNKYAENQNNINKQKNSKNFDSYNNSKDIFDDTPVNNLYQNRIDNQKTSNFFGWDTDDDKKYDSPKERKYAVYNEEAEEPTVDIFNENKKYISELDEKNKQLKIKQEELEIKSEFKLIGQVLQTYLIFEKGDELYLIDQHAAHERLKFDEFMRQFNEKRVVVQDMLFPIIIHTDELEGDYLIDQFEYLHKMEFEICEKEYNEFAVYALPLVFFDIDMEKFVREIIDDTSLRGETVPEVIYEKIAQKACKSAIKSGKILSDSEINDLLKALKENMGLRCPHGRPIAVKITRKEIDKWFKRIV